MQDFNSDTGKEIITYPLFSLFSPKVFSPLEAVAQLYVSLMN